MIEYYYFTTGTIDKVTKPFFKHQTLEHGAMELYIS